MAQKFPTQLGVFESLGRAVDESMEMAAALREGKLTRKQFDEWYSKRSAESMDLIVNMRQRTGRMLEPVASALGQGLARGRHALRNAVTQAPRRAHHRRRAGPPANLPPRRG